MNVFIAKKLTVRARLMAGFGLITGLLVLVALFAWFEIRLVNKAMDDALDEQGSIIRIKELESLLSKEYFTMWNLVATYDGAKREAIKVDIGILTSRYREILLNLQETMVGEESLALLGSLSLALDALGTANGRILATSIDGISAASLPYTGTDGSTGASTFTNPSMEEFRKGGVVIMETQVNPLIAALLLVQDKEIRLIESRVRDSRLWSGIILLAVTGMTVLLSMVLGQKISKSLTQAIQDSLVITKKFADGDFTASGSLGVRKRGDELGDLARSIYTVGEHTKLLLGTLVDGIKTIDGSTEALFTASTVGIDLGKTMAQKSQNMANLARRASEATGQVAGQLTAASASLVGVAGATEEMSITVEDIARRADRARTIGLDAQGIQAEVSGVVEELQRSLKQISKVTEAIMEISAQTNLLALNATIEAARAGASGRGFAVVAQEIKDLANQTASATVDIKERISSVQIAGNRAREGLANIQAVVLESSGLLEGIASAISQQAGATKEVAERVSEASTLVAGTNDTLVETAMTARLVANEATELSTTSQDVEANALRVGEGAKTILTLGGEIGGLAKTFKI